MNTFEIWGSNTLSKAFIVDEQLAEERGLAIAFNNKQYKSANEALKMAKEFARDVITQSSNNRLVKEARQVLDACSDWEENEFELCI